MMIIGLTGGIGAGKSTAASMLKKAHIPVVDADEISRQLTIKDRLLLEDIVLAFGPDVINAQGELNRQMLAKMVFNDKQLLHKLEGLLHPKIEKARKICFEELKAQGVKVAVYMAPLIFEKGLHKQLSKTILITADPSLIRWRLQMRENLSTTDLQNRIKAQFTDAQKIALADEVVENNGTLQELYNKLSISWKTLTGAPLPASSSNA